jgi:hypothetical protein
LGELFPVSRYKREQLELLWDVRVGPLVGISLKNYKFYP